MKRIHRVAILGAGTMGARIAAHFANAGVPSLLLDIVPTNAPPDRDGPARNKIAAAGLDGAQKIQARGILRSRHSPVWSP
jgi:3-hydroxyacyl-CoA dehydrogenase